MSDTLCVMCDQPASGRHSLPINTRTDVVHSAERGEWAGVPSCENCFNVHVAISKGPYLSPIFVDAIMCAHVAAVAQLNAQLDHCRMFFNKLHVITENARDFLSTGEE